MIVFLPASCSPSLPDSVLLIQTRDAMLVVDPEYILSAHLSSQLLSSFPSHQASLCLYQVSSFGLKQRHNYMLNFLFPPEHRTLLSLACVST